MLKRFIQDAEYEIVSEFYDNGDSSSVAKTIVDEGETPVNTYRLCVGSKNPVTQISFNKNLNLLNDYLINNDELLWVPYWEDSAPEEGGE